tara:strand:+ start:1389 stop:1604 length:216 start_codon:yes stop_codon:yes gene_type:complete
MDEYGNERGGSDETGCYEIDVEKTMKWRARNPDKKERIFYRLRTEVLMYRMGWVNSKPPKAHDPHWMENLS